MSDQKEFTNLQNEIDKISEKWADDIANDLEKRFKKMVALALGYDPKDAVMVSEFRPWYEETRQNGEEFNSRHHLYKKLRDKKKRQIINEMLAARSAAKEE